MKLKISILEVEVTFEHEFYVKIIKDLIFMREKNYYRISLSNGIIYGQMITCT